MFGVFYQHQVTSDKVQVQPTHTVAYSSLTCVTVLIQFLHLMLSEKEKVIWSQTKLPYLPESIQSTKAKAATNVWRPFLFCIKEHNHVGE